MKGFFTTLLLIFVLIISLVAENVKVDFKMQWFPQAQFTGYIIALEKGFYAEEGIDINLLFSDGSDNPIQEILSGETEFCTTWLSQAMTLRSEGKELVNISQILQKSSLMLISKKKSNIEKPEDMNGKMISLWSGAFSIQPLAFFKKFKIKFKNIPQSYSIYSFLADACDVTSAMYYNEYNRIIQAGINKDELNLFFFSDYGLNFPEDGIYCSETYFKKNNVICKKMRKASIKGWNYAFKNPEESLDILMKYCDRFHLMTNKTQQKWMLKVILESITYGIKDKSNRGVLRKEDYQKVGLILKEQGIIKDIPLYNVFYKGKRNGRD